MKILFSGFLNENIECVYGDYNFLRDCGPYAFFSKYTEHPPGITIDDKYHKGFKNLRKEIKYNKYNKYFKFEGGPLVGIKSLIYNLSLRSNFEIEVSNDLSKFKKNINEYDFLYIHSLNESLKKEILELGNKLDNKLILSLHVFTVDKNICNQLKNLKFIKWSHNINKPANYYLPYPIHKSLYHKYPLDIINKNRKNKIMIYTKVSSSNKNKIQELIKKRDLIKKYFNKNNYECNLFCYTKTGFRRSELMKSANECKLCIYLSFYDDGALAINEITMMGCYMIGFKEIIKGHSYHSVAQSCLLDGKNGEFIDDFAHIFKNNTDEYLHKCCDKVLNILNNRKLDHLDIAKKTREYMTDELFLETIFKK